MAIREQLDTQHDPWLTTLGQLATASLTRLCEGLGEISSERAAAVLGMMSSSWSALPALANPHWPSDITDDGSPVEFSIAFDGPRPTLRILIEPQGSPASLDSNWLAGLELNRQLARESGVDTRRFDHIRDLFAPAHSTSDARFAIWHSAALDPDGTGLFKVYLNPQIGGASEAATRVGEALSTLGFAALGQQISNFAGSERYVYFSLDLAASRHARVKIYTTHPATEAAELDRELSRAGLCRRGQLAQWVESLTGGRPSLDQRGIQICHAITSAGQEPSITLYVPVRSHCESDAEAIERAGAFLDAAQHHQLSQAVQHFAGRGLESGRGLVTYVAVRPGSSGSRVTVYLSPQLYAIAAVRSTPPSLRSSLRPSPRTSLGVPPALVSMRVPRAAHEPTLPFDLILRAIEGQRAALSRHPFIQYLETAIGTREELQRISARMAFFVLCFQDVLRLVRDTTSHPYLRQLATVHEREDKGHDHWYLHDLERFGVQLGISDLFSSETTRVRDAAYTQISDVLKATDDCSRLAVVLSLEAAGAVCFRSIISFIERINCTDDLLYFARRHQQVEQGHDVFAKDAQDHLESFEVTSAALPEVLAAVERTFGTMSQISTDLLFEVQRCHGERGRP